MGDATIHTFEEWVAHVFKKYLQVISARMNTCGVHLYGSQPSFEGHPVRSSLQFFPIIRGTPYRPVHGS